MAWTDDLLEAQYTSPSGKKFYFRWGDVSKETDLKTSSYTFPSKDGALIQSLGRGGRRFPLSCVFSGENCISEADSFEEGLEESGIGELQHPVYGVRKVVPTGSIKRTDNIVSGSNVSTVEVTFAETITESVMPDSKTSKDDAIAESSEVVEDMACDDFANSIAADNASEEIKLKETAKKSFITSFNGMEDSAQSLSANESLYQTYQALKNQGLDFVNKIGQDLNAPLNFARTLFNVVKLPSKIVTSLAKTVEGYTGLYASLLTAFITDPVGINNVINQFNSTKLSLLATLTSFASALTGVASSTGEKVSSTEDESESAGESTGFKNREEAIDAISSLDEIYDNYIEYVDKYTGQDLFIDTSEIAYEIEKLIEETERYVLEIAFDLPTKRTIILGRDRQLLELLTELYGNLDHIDEFIQDNNLNADELEVLPMGREVVYYVS